MRKRIASIFLALLVISSGVAAPVSAQTDSGDCNDLMSFIQNTVVLGLTGTQLEKCSPQSDAIEEMKESDAAQEKIDIYNSALGLNSEHEEFTTVYDNYLNDTESVAWMKAQVAIAEAYEDGKSESQAKSAARQAIADYYAVKQDNLLSSMSSRTSQIHYIAQTAKNESDINSDYIYSRTDHNDGSDYDGHAEVVGTVNKSYDLVNGSSEQYTAFRVHMWSANADIGEHDWSMADHPSGSNGLSLAPPLKVKAPNSNYDEVVIFEYTPYEERLNRIQSKNNELQGEVENFVSSTWDDYAAGSINSSDVISANTAMFEYGTEATSNDSSLYDSTAALSMMGFDTPNMSNSGTQDVTYNGNTYTGIVLARNAPGGSWETGTTYNTSNITGPVFMATTDGQKIDFADGSEFTIDQMRAKDGTNTTSVETTKYVYKTANTSELNQMQSDLTDLRAEIEAREPSGGGGSGSGIGTNTIIAAAALAGAALLFGRGNQ